jgi:predicted transcriptional regulator
MNEQMIYLSKDFQIEARLYAIMKTAILGLPNSGKSHTALVLAEELLENNIPLVAFDPAGVWWSLKVGVKGNKGYPVVVAGGEHADIPLTPQSAKDIMDAAMKENISIVFDLSGEETAHKSDWRKIVKDTVNHLYFHNKQYGLRHIFLEEAAEFCPQRIIDFDVYSVIDKTIRIGRNKGLGITLVNQRAAAINKEAYENCNLNILHNQEGKNSLKQIQDWFTLKRESQAKEIMESIPNLKAGQCWIIGNRLLPVLVQVRERKTFHPDPYQQSNVIPPNAKKANVLEFVARLAHQVHALENKKEEQPTKADSHEVKVLQDRLSQATQRIDTYQDEIRKLHTSHQVLLERMGKAAEILSNGKNEVPPFTMQDFDKGLMLAGHIEPKNEVEKKQKQIVAEYEAKVPSGSGKTKIMQAIHTIFPHPIKKEQIGILSGMSYKGGTFQEYMRQLKRENCIEENAEGFTITDKGRSLIAINGHQQPLPMNTAYLVELWAAIEGGKKATMLRTLYQAPYGRLKKDALADLSGMAGSGGTFQEYKRQLKRKGLITEINGILHLADVFYSFAKHIKST